MFNKVVPFSDLVAQRRWKVGSFVTEGNGATSTAYPLCPLRELLVERRETLDPQQYPDHLFHYIGLEHVQSLTGDLSDGYRPREGRAVLSRSKVFYRGDILYGRLRPALNKVFVADGPITEGICSGEFYVFIPDQKRLLPHFARAVLASRYVQDFVARLTTGSALPRLALEDLVAIEVPLPPVDVQRHYEKALLQQNWKRQQLIAELRAGPAADLEAIVTALEEGREPIFTHRPLPEAFDLSELKLPDIAIISRGARSLPRRPRSRSAGSPRRSTP